MYSLCIACVVPSTGMLLNRDLARSLCAGNEGTAIGLVWDMGCHAFRGLILSANHRANGAITNIGLSS